MLSVTDLLERAAEWSGDLIVASGTLAATLDGLYLVDPGLPIDRWEERRIAIDAPTLVDLMLRTVPARGGGPFMYFDEVTLEARVRPGEEPALHSVARLVLRRDSESYEVLPD